MILMSGGMDTDIGVIWKKSIGFLTHKREGVGVLLQCCNGVSLSPSWHQKMDLIQQWVDESFKREKNQREQSSEGIRDLELNNLDQLTRLPDGIDPEKVSKTISVRGVI